MPTVSTQTYSFDTREYACFLLQRLNKQRSVDEFCDAELKVGDRTFHAHKAVLSASSEYFHAMFTGGLAEKTSDSVVLHEIETCVFESLLNFIYAEDVHVTNANCQDLLMAADMFSLSQVKQLCCDYMSAHIDNTNCIGVYLLADQYSCPDLKAVCERYMQGHFLQVSQQEEFLCLSHFEIEKLVQSEHLNIEHESQVFTTSLKWFMHNVTDRRQHVFNVLQWIRFPIIPQDQIQKILDTCNDLSLQVAIQKLVQDCGGRRKRASKLWRECSALPRLSAQRHLYVIGGYSRAIGGRWSDSMSLSSVEHYDFVKHCWTSVPSMTTRRSSHGAVAHNGRIYVIGGENDSLIYASGESYDPITNKWTMLPSMNSPRCGLGVCVVDDYIYALGGWIGSEIGKTIEKFDIHTQTWVVCGMLRTLLFGMGIVASHGCIYVLGGQNDLGTELCSVECYDVDEELWISLPDMKCPRAHVATVIHDDYLYAIGGWNERDNALKTAERFSLVEQTWEPLPSMNKARAGPSICVVHGLIYVIGGRTCSDEFTAPATLDSVECFDPDTCTWLEPDMDITTGRCEAVAVVV